MEPSGKQIVLSGWRIPVAIVCLVVTALSAGLLAFVPAQESGWIITGLVGLGVSIVSLLVVGLTALKS